MAISKDSSARMQSHQGLFTIANLIICYRIKFVRVFAIQLSEEKPEKPNIALEIAQSTQKKRKRPDQPVIFQVQNLFYNKFNNNIIIFKIYSFLKIFL